MSWTLPYRAALSAFVGAVALVSTLSAPAHAAEQPVAAPAYSTSHMPAPPRLPRDFRGKGTWIVRDLGITVPFTWEGRDGDSQMTAGGPRYPIWFTNLIYRGSLYTLTYKWPGPVSHACSRIPGFGLTQLNDALRGARFVGSEILQGSADRRVNHWRVGVVVPKRPPGSFLRLPLALGDVYVDQDDRGTFWQVLQFGVQNLFDPQLDEWLQMRTFDHRPGVVDLPRRCAALAQT
ncbi:hypothetical protein [Actinospica robiniae]|uniref:hypothetical protein n=1 Tax=Actinospica robiniae TaxID=304901 RepID=UPI00040A682D|nr:hypothetical protein [Actinospica robiniae]